MKRKDCFFGLHFDYHANEHTSQIGKDFRKDVVERIVTEVQPDFIQCDTKGHPGYCSYMTNVGTRGDLTTDILAGWREVTKKHGVLLFSHYSGLWDMKAAKDHPEWTASSPIQPELKDRLTPFGDYADKLLIPQLKELALDVGMDGAWVDGECWALPFDVSEPALNAYRQETGKEFDYETATEAEKKDYMAFIRRGFFRYVDHYIKEVKKVAPNFEITSNWLNTRHVPENIHITDYISGDISPTNSVDSARYDGRIMQSFGRNWDIMSWGISYPVHFSKSAAQLCQEAAIIVSLGGCYQVYNMQSPQKTVMDESAIPTWAEVSRFCKSRKEYCHNAVIKPDVGILYSPKGHRASDYLVPFSNNNPYILEFNGTLLALCDAGRSVSALHAERIHEFDLSKFNTIVVSNQLEMEADTKAALLAYAKAGGELLLCGVDTVNLFAADLQLEVASHQGDTPIALFTGENYEMEVRTPYVHVCGQNAILGMHPCLVEGDLACTNPPPTIVPLEQTIPACLKCAYGEGNVCIVPANLGRFYQETNTYQAKKFFADVVKALRPGTVSISTPAAVDVLITEKNGKDYIHLINLLGEHRSNTVKTFDYIPPVPNVEIAYRTQAVPTAVCCQPGNKPVAWHMENGTLHIRLDSVALYDILEITY